MTVWLDTDANPSAIKKVLKNMKGVAKISVRKEKGQKSVTDDKEDKWLSELHRLVKNVDTSVIDMNDERTRYIMSK